MWFTLREASLSEVYYPDLGTPSLRGLEFAVTDGRTFVDRETRATRHVDRSPGVRARCPGSLTFRQITETPRWRLTKTWITDPRRRQRCSRDVRFDVADRRARCELYALADPAPGDDGNDDRGGIATVTAARPRRHRRELVIAAAPALDQTTSGYRGTASDPWQDLSADQRPRPRLRRDASPATSCRRARTRARPGCGGSRHLKLAIGFGARRSRRGPARPRLACAAASPAPAQRYAAGWQDYLASLSRAAARASPATARC